MQYSGKRRLVAGLALALTTSVCAFFYRQPSSAAFAATPKIFSGARPYTARQASIVDYDGPPEGSNPAKPLQDKAKNAMTNLQSRATELRDGLRERGENLQTRVGDTINSAQSEVVSPLLKFAENPVSAQYGAAMAIRLSYFIAQQTVVTTTVDRKLRVDVLAVARAVIAAIAHGREKDVLDALRINDDFVTSKESYSWWSRNLEGIVALLMREAHSIEDGEYKMPHDLVPSRRLGRLNILSSFSTYYREQQRHRKYKLEAAKPASRGAEFKAPGRYPSYFLEQEDFLDARQAKLMDYELESQVWGMASAMYRRSIAKIDAYLLTKDPETSTLLDVGCGSGRFLTFVRDNFKLLKLTALDLSLFNLQQAKANLSGQERVTFVEASAETMPIDSETQDVITCNFLLSRLPRENQVNAINEMARCLKPGGKISIVDCTQPDYDGKDVCTFDELPTANVSPYYAAYQHCDLEYALIKAGLFVQDKEINWVSKVLVAQKPPLATGGAPGEEIEGVGY
ncbi:unnamed protein product [Chrysoparadoxa australica]